VLHKKTEIEGIVNKDSNMLVSVLHPTAAVGLPKLLKILFKNGDYDRDYYTGF
jgi:isochorismate synthase EntC